jgi:hypothetical protein
VRAGTGSAIGSSHVVSLVGRGMSLALGFAVMLAVVVLVPGVALACSCPEPDSPQVAREQSAAVFAGRVVRIRPVGLLDVGPDRRVVATVEVQQVWKGPVQQRVAVVTERDEALCGYPFARGQEVLVYAQEHADQLRTGLCTRTTLLRLADEDLAVLGQGTTPPAAPLALQVVQPLLDRPLITGLALALLVAAGLWLRRRAGRGRPQRARD